LEEEGVKVHALEISSKFFWLGKLVHASRLTREIRPDVIQTWMPHADFFGTLLAPLARVRKIYWGVRNGTYNEVHSPLGTRLIVRLLAFLSWFAPDAIVSCSEAAVGSHVALGYNPGKFVVIPNGVDTRAFGPRRKNDALAPTSVFLIGMFARFHPQKDHYSFLKSISVLSQNGFRCDAILVGNGVDSNNVLLNRWIDELGIRKRVTLLGARTDVSELMNSVDLVVMCSTFGEGFPNVVAEAMATGTPCVVTDVGDALSIVGELGWQAETANPVDLASTIAEAYADIQLEPPNIGAIRAARISKNYSLRTMVERFDSLYDLVSIAFLTRYSIQGASSRVRALQYVPQFSRRRVSVFQSSLIPAGSYSSDLYGPIKVLGLYMEFTRAIWAARRYDRVWIEGELFPYIPWFLESLAHGILNSVVVDYDDAVYLRYSSHPSRIVRLLLGKKFQKVVGNADLVLLGNQFLKQKALETVSESKVLVIPSSINLDRYSSEATAENLGANKRIGWIGTQSTWDKYCDPLRELFIQVAERNHAIFTVIGPKIDYQSANFEAFEWSLKTEVGLLKALTVGVMPLDDSEWSLGKCGYKILQYMGSGVPVVASGFGANLEIIKHGVNGLLVSDDEGWGDAIEFLLKNPRAREKMAARALETVAASYSTAQSFIAMEDALRGPLR
jgi:glycosyltransferase involved in cell wall biosynthesis